MSLLEQAKRSAAYAAVDEFVRPGMCIGVGSGSTVVYMVERLKELRLPGIICVPTSFQAKNLIIEAGLVLSDLNVHSELDVAIDGADECDSALNCIKGGGGAQTQEKCVAFCAKTFVVIADHTKKSAVLGEKWKKGVPVEVLPFAYVAVSKALEKLGGKPVLRMAKAKAGPVVTDNGNFVIDVDFGLIKDPARLEHEISTIPGVVEVGLFVGMVSKAFFGNEDGTVTTVLRTP
jgi:ribose 5-phosphate isomerase A